MDIIQMICEKGTIGLTLSQSNMPFSKEGISPDLIINPQGIPSRMCVGHLLECLFGKAGAIKGMEVDGTSFNEIDIEKIKDILEEHGYERNATEYLYNGMTGQKMHVPIYIGPTYYQRLKHLVMDKMHCLKCETTEILTLNGWKKYGEFTKNDYIATLVDNKLIYEKPKEIFYYPNFNDKLYHISNSSIELDVTMKHRMWVSKLFGRAQKWQPYDFEYAEDIIGKQRKYKKDAEWDVPDYQFILKSFTDGNNKFYENKNVSMNDWLIFFGIWMAEGCAGSRKCVQIAVNKQRVKDALYPALTNMGFEYKVNGEKLSIYNMQLYNYMKDLSVGAPNKYLPDWCYKLSKLQSQILVNSMLLGDGYFSNRTTASWYSSSSKKLADDFQRLCLHAGYASNIFKHVEAEKNKVQINGRDVVNHHDIWRISVIKTKINPGVNHGHKNSQNVQQEYVYNYTGPVFCVEVNSGVFMIRSNGKTCWTGNSRSRGPITMLTHQP